MLLTISILCIIGIAVFIYQYVVIEKFKQLKIPIVSGLPILGNYSHLGPNYQEFHKYLIVKKSIYFPKLFGLLFGRKLELICVEAELTSRILGSEKHQRKGFIFRNVNSIIDGGFANSTDSKFEKQREILISALSLEFMKKIICVISKTSDELVESLRKSEDILPPIKRYASSTILKTLVGDTIENPRKFMKLLQECCEIDMIRTFSLWQRCDFLYGLSSLSKRQNEIKKEVNKILMESIENHRNKPSTPLVLDVLLRDLPNDELTDVKDILLTLIINSNDVLSSLIGFTVYELARNYTIQEKLREEINSVVGVNKKSEPTVKQINDMEYLNLVFKETLRLYATHIHSEFTLAENIKYKNTTLPKGSSILIDIHTIHQNPSYHENPTLYNPERFLPKYMERTKTNTFFPFGGGFKTYLGHSLLELEFKVAIIKIIQNFNIKELKSFVAETKICNNTFKPANGLLVILENRVNSN